MKISKKSSIGVLIAVALLLSAVFAMAVSSVPLEDSQREKQTDKFEEIALQHVSQTHGIPVEQLWISHKTQAYYRLTDQKFWCVVVRDKESNVYGVYIDLDGNIMEDKDIRKAYKEEQEAYTNKYGKLAPKVTDLYAELEGDIKLLILERRTEEKEGYHIFLNLATERIYGNCDHQLNSDVKIQGDTIIVEVKNVHLCGHSEAEGPATFSEDLDRIEGDYQLILRHKSKEDKYNLKITKDKIEINPIISTFTVFNQPNILFRVPENVIWIDCGHYDRVGCEENQEYIKICDQFFKEPLISNLQPFESEEGEYALKGFNKGHKHFKFFGNISDLQELVESYAIYSFRTKDKERCLLLAIRTWKGDFFYSWERRKNV
ncbi:MAG: hypothetical protein U9O85_00200 [Euryarchaeota archaeon]|nr:hypothetical protein [Euryarchaeota archaeon]